jgi:hypothetical protein
MFAEKGSGEKTGYKNILCGDIKRQDTTTVQSMRLMVIGRGKTEAALCFVLGEPFHIVTDSNFLDDTRALRCYSFL